MKYDREPRQESRSRPLTLRKDKEADAENWHWDGKVCI